MTRLDFHNQELLDYMSMLYRACPPSVYQPTNTDKPEKYDEKTYISRNFFLTRETAKIITEKGVLLDLGSSISPQGSFLLYKNIISSLICIDKGRLQLENVKTLLTVLKAKNPVNPIYSSFTSYSYIPLSRNSCDYIISFDFLFREFLDPTISNMVLNDCYRVLKKRGKIFIVVYFEKEQQPTVKPTSIRPATEIMSLGLTGARMNLLRVGEHKLKGIDGRFDFVLGSKQH